MLVWTIYQFQNKSLDENKIADLKVICEKSRNYVYIIKNI